MLVPVVWFEESAMIPEETAKMFKSIYTDKIRLIRTVIGSLFFIALGVSITALVASHYFANFCNNFKLKNCPTTKTTTTIDNHKSGSIESSGNGAGSSMTSSSTKSGQSIISANDDASCLIYNEVGSKQMNDRKQYEPNNAELPLLANSNNNEQQLLTELVKQEQQNENDYLQSSNKPTKNDKRNLNENKSVEFAVHYNDTLLLVEGQSQHQHSRHNNNKEQVKQQQQQPLRR